ncbi:HrpB1 family type III secretion system apparatus protein [Schlegelella sp. S2-27]|uniref:HrpB1 family type III secretion system apparatus protein n=1 Tax=Caldimonas mangrovi TaxID=2944811 RepID=A0ABT0YLD8_9BURK|nr:HrpB1 family type III secretion system apparatus protein [Caldimonas mangrovi]MCM5679540.1 HrpB1 family type III secretion system apparatus protein [Caldimonas mangrovi]
MNHIESPEARELVQSIFKACAECRADDAEADWHRLQYLGPLPELTKVIPAFIMMSRGQNLDALRYMNELPEDLSPSTKVVCLRMVGDPTWRSAADALMDDPDPTVREAMRQLVETAVPSYC